MSKALVPEKAGNALGQGKESLVRPARCSPCIRRYELLGQTLPSLGFIGVQYCPVNSPVTNFLPRDWSSTLTVVSGGWNLTRLFTGVDDLTDPGRYTHRKYVWQSPPLATDGPALCFVYFIA